MHRRDVGLGCRIEQLLGRTGTNSASMSQRNDKLQHRVCRCRNRCLTAPYSRRDVDEDVLTGLMKPASRSAAFRRRSRRD